MADARGWLLIALLVVSGTAAAAGPCEEGRGQAGVAVAAGPDGGLAVTAVDPESPAAAAGVSVGDAVVQVNASLPRGCADWARALRDARRERKAILLLVRRGTAEVPLALAAATWSRPVAVVATAPPAEAPSVRHLVSAPPPPLPPETSVSLEEVTGGLAALARAADRGGGGLDPYQRDLLRIGQQVETLAARGSVSPDVQEGLRTVLGYYQAVGVAWASEETQREREGRPRHLPPREGGTAPFFEDSAIAAAIDRFPFLRATVARDPSPNGIGGESAGLWRPQEARALLAEHGREELERLNRWLASAER
jgi:hypothetical protein